MPDRPPNDVIFEEALGKPTPEERDAYLDRACWGDGRLRRRMARMVEAQLAAGGFLESPVAGSGGLAGLTGDPALAIDPESVASTPEGLPPAFWAPPTGPTRWAG